MIEEKDINNELDLYLERKSHLSVDTLWNAWTKPKILKQWLCPKPWTVEDCRLNLKPGGQFYLKMVGENNESHESKGAFLVIIPKKQLTWTNMMSEGFQPNSAISLDFPFVVSIHISKIQEGSLYQVKVQHADKDGKEKHEQMGFYSGWNQAFDQLLELS